MQTWSDAVEADEQRNLNVKSSLKRENSSSSRNSSAPDQTPALASYFSRDSRDTSPLDASRKGALKESRNQTAKCFLSASVEARVCSQCVE